MGPAVRPCAALCIPRSSPRFDIAPSHLHCVCVLIIHSAMASNLENYIGRTVLVITLDGRQIVGTLKGFDQMINIVMDDCHERVYNSITGVEQVPLGLYIMRGENVAVIGEIDEELDKRVNYSMIRADALKPIVH